MTDEAVITQVGSKVVLEYVLYDTRGNILDSSKGLGPMSITLGKKEVLPALEIALSGLHVGDTKTIELPAKIAYGSIKKSAFKTIPLEDLPADSRQPGVILGIDDNGTMRQVKVHEVDGDTAVLDFNHPLAGKDIVYEVHIIDIELP